MIDNIPFYLHGIPSELTIGLLAILPIGELRASIPIAISIFEMHWSKAYIISCIGNMIPAFVLIWLLPIVVEWSEKNIPSLGRVMNRYFHHIKSRHLEKYNLYGIAALFLLVAIPLPFTGVWSASIFASLMHLPKQKSLISMFLGVLVAGILVVLMTQGAIKTFS